MECRTKLFCITLTYIYNDGTSERATHFITGKPLSIPQKKWEKILKSRGIEHLEEQKGTRNLTYILKKKSCTFLKWGKPIITHWPDTVGLKTKALIRTTLQITLPHTEYITPRCKGRLAWNRCFAKGWIRASVSLIRWRFGLQSHAYFSQLICVTQYIILLKYCQNGKTKPAK